MERTTPTGPDLAAFGKWVDDTLDMLKEKRKMSVRQVALKSKVQRSIIYRWINAEVVPQKPVVTRFCVNLDLPMEEPFALMGWAVESVPPPKPPPTMGDQYRELLDIRYETPDLTPEEESDLDAQIERAVELLKLRREMRRKDGDADNRSA